MDSVDRETSELLSNFTSETNRFSLERIAELELMALHLPYILNDEKEVSLFLQKQIISMPFFTGLGFISPDGTIIAADGTKFALEERGSLERALTGEIVFSDIFPFYQDSSQKVTSILVPVSLNGEIIGVVSGVVNMGNLIGSLVEESSLPGTVFLLKGSELVFTSHTEGAAARIETYKKKMMSEIKNETSGSWLLNKNTAHFVKYQHAWDDWVVIVDSSSNPDTKQIRLSLWQNSIIVLLTIGIIGGVLVYLRLLDKREDLLMKQDLLTGLGNRAQLEQDLTNRLQQNTAKTASLFMINLDHFKDLNERIGYQVGDQILFSVSRRLKQLTNKENLYRVGGDEFIVLIAMDTEEEQASMASTILKLIDSPISIGEDYPTPITASIGVRPIRNCDHVDLLLQDLTFSVQEAKRLGGNQYVLFTDDFATTTEHHRLLANSLDRALTNEEFYLLYQPIYGVSAETVISFETLMRWNSPLVGEVGPAEFIPMLEENDMIIPVSRWLIRQVSTQVKAWEDSGYTTITVALNISVKQLVHPDFLGDVRTILTETKVRPEMLIFEITESVAADNIGLATQVLLTINSFGIKTALDDFGTGYSSLSILKLLPIQYLKVDRAFVMEVESDGGISRSILKGIIGIAKDLDMTTVMEGIETKEQFNLLKEMGADRIQGYFISKPIAPEDAIQFASKQKVY